eukprot:gene22094-29153_t
MVTSTTETITTRNGDIVEKIVRRSVYRGVKRSPPGIAE